jgi:hypothetical protein
MLIVSLDDLKNSLDGTWWWHIYMSFGFQARATMGEL